MESHPQSITTYWRCVIALLIIAALVWGTLLWWWHQPDRHVTTNGNTTTLFPDTLVNDVTSSAPAVR